MRKIIIMRGLPGSGKSTWIKNHGLEAYTLCTDNIRKLISNPVMVLDFPFHSINQGKDMKAWKILFECLEDRMKNGNFTVVDATTLTEEQWSKYKDLIKKYRYRAMVVDFIDLPLEDVKMQNNERWNTTGYVPEWVLDKYAKRWEDTNEYINHNQIKVIKPTDEYEFEQFMQMPPLDLKQMEYKKIVFIGDIHGCWSALNNYFKDTTPADHPDTWYIFLGDYLDRGFENAEVFKALYAWKDMDNVFLLEGNHESHWRDYLRDDLPENIDRIRFYMETIPELEKAGITKKDISRLTMKLGQCAYLQNGNTQIFACHAGIAGMMHTYYPAVSVEGDENVEEPETRIPTLFEDSHFLTTLNTRQMTHGVGGYNQVDTLAEKWEEYNDACKMCYTDKNFNIYQIFGHRNPEQKFPVQVTDHVFCLEGGVYELLNENARLRIVEYDVEADKFTPVEVFNPKWNYGYENTPNPHTAYVKDRMLQMNELIKAKNLHDNVYAFNFTHEAWYSRGWNDLVCKARGLFIDCEKNVVVARSYDKFFNYKERRETKNLDWMLEHLQYPVTVFEKYNGFLGILSIYNGELLFCSKSEDHLSTYSDGHEEERDGFPSNYMALLFKKQFEELVPEETQVKIKNWLLKKNCSMLFEVINPTLDPHIVPYKENRLVLLDIVYNDIEKPMRLMGYESLKALNDGLFHLDLKQIIYIIDDKDKMKDFVEAMFKIKNIGKEGYVCKDSKGYMIKFKTADYMFWKDMRTMCGAINGAEYGCIPTYWKLKEYMVDKYSEEIVEYYQEYFHKCVEVLLEKFGVNRRDKIELPPGFMNRPDGSKMNILDIRKLCESSIKM